MPYIIDEKIKIGVSACNFGARVRYNRKGWDRVSKLEREKDAFIWTPVCPEVMSGLGVPREPMKLVDGNGDKFWQGQARMKNKRGKEVTVQVRKGAQTAMDNLKRAEVEAFVFMEGSPSCGVYRTTLKNARLGKPPGVFGSLLLKSELFLIPALDLESPVKWWDWRRRLHAFVYLKRAKLNTKKEIYNIWHDYKFLVQEISRKEADIIGSEIAAWPDKITASIIKKWRMKVLLILRQPSTAKRIENSAEKHISFACKHLNVCYDKKLPNSELGKRKFVEKLIELEKQAINNNINYGFVPVLFREKSR
jgi:uncharacterized protein YbbK (DUF523 family)